MLGMTEASLIEHPSLNWDGNSMASEPDPQKTGLALRIEFGVLLIVSLISIVWAILTLVAWLT